MTLELDHIAVVAATLEEGVAYVEDSLGVTMQPGGQHPDMGTHNQLLGLGGDVYLEVVAVDPTLSAPDHPRWFGLDAFSGAPRLAGWVVRAEDFEKCQRMAPFGMSSSLSLSRGSYRWNMLLPSGDPSPYDGYAPGIIEWVEGGHPCDRLRDVGARFRSLNVAHPKMPDMVAEFPNLFSLADVHFEVAAVPGLTLKIETPSGLRELV